MDDTQPSPGQGAAGPGPAKPGARTRRAGTGIRSRGPPGGSQVTEAWQARAAALDTYRNTLARERDPLTVARSLHQHHVRALGVSPSTEATTLRLVRTAALQHRMASR